jgi:hypothetical protein
MRDGASRPFILSCGIRRFALIASQKSHDTFCFCLYRAINSGRELVCAKKNLRLISKRIVRFLIATPRGRRTYPESRINRWLITRRCAAPQAKPAVFRDICGEPWPGSGHYGRTSRGEANTCEALALSNVKKYRCDPIRTCIHRR